MLGSISIHGNANADMLPVFPDELLHPGGAIE
jgi:hypothetical protein